MALITIAKKMAFFVLFANDASLKPPVIVNLQLVQHPQFRLPNIPFFIKR